MPEPFTCSFGLKSVEETTHEGQEGLLLTGYATRFGEVDQSGEHMTKGALRDLDETWGQQPIVLFEHGLSDLGTRRIGRATSHHIDSDGLRVRVFVPKEPGWKDQRAVRAFRDVYAQIKRGVLRGFSVGGTYTRDAAGAIKRWSMLELSVVSKPCLPSATFAVGAKAVSEAYGALPAILDDDVGPDVLRARLDALAERLDLLEAATKAAPMKSEPDGADHPRSHYLYTPSDNVSQWKLRVRNAQGDLDPRLLGAAHAALLSAGGYRGQKVQLPDAAKAQAVAKLRALYKQAGLDWPDEGSGSGSKTALSAPDELLLLQHYARRNDRHAARTLRAALDVLNDFARGTKAGRMHSAATVATVRKIADGLQGHVDALRDHFGVAQDDEAGDEEPEQAHALMD